MTKVLKGPVKIDRENNREVQKRNTNYARVDRGLAIAFSGDIKKHWRSRIPGKDLF